MINVLHIPYDQDFKTMDDIRDAFKMDIQKGFEKNNKTIPSKHLYDEHGCELFNKITRHPDYYLTNCELEILSNHKQSISKLIGSEPFNLVELGPGEGIKTKILMEQFLQDSSNVIYIPIDISDKYLKNLICQFKLSIPNFNSTAIHSDYFKGLEWLNNHSKNRNVVLFLGSSIGNFNPALTEEFLQHLHSVLRNGDYVLIGFDLCKDTNVLMNAYNDSDGITRDFNLNLLTRINRELGANFDINKFRHYPTYNVYQNAMESYLISLESQVVEIESLERSYFFSAIEPIHVEFSYKYNLLQIADLAYKAGFNIVQHFTDSKNYFLDTLWCVNK